MREVSHWPFPRHHPGVPKSARRGIDSLHRSAPAVALVAFVALRSSRRRCHRYPSLTVAAPEVPAVQRHTASLSSCTLPCSSAFLPLAISRVATLILVNAPVLPTCLTPPLSCTAVTVSLDTVCPSQRARLSSELSSSQKNTLPAQNHHHAASPITPNFSPLPVAATATGVRAP